MSAIGFDASGTMLNFDVATHESSQDLLVSIHNAIYPIDEYVLHQVFDTYGYVENIDISRLSEPLQAIIRYDSCQNAVSAKIQLQGRYIYDTCCQLVIQFYKKNMYADKSENRLIGNEFELDRDFIRSKLHEMMDIIEKMQDRMKSMNSSIKKISHTTSDSSAGPIAASTEIFSSPMLNVPNPVQFQTQPESECKKQIEDRNEKFILHIGSSPDGPHSNWFDLSSQGAVQYTEAKNFRVYDLFNQVIPLKNSVHYQSDVYYSKAALYNDLYATIALNSTWLTEQEWISVHHIFAEMNKLGLEWTSAPILFVEMNKLKRERKVFIFDPGGISHANQHFQSLTLRTRSFSERMVMMRL